MQPHPDSATLLARLPAQLGALLARTAHAAEAQGAGLWLVGGAVRDLLLGLPLGRDVDLAVEGDTPALAVALAKAEGGRVVATHTPFGTASIELPRAGEGPLVLDLARTRVERYARPAALPEVAPTSITDDLVRRDFSVNAVALELRTAGGALGAGRLLDPFGGRDDLAAGLLRLLHPNSLRDDPTRMLRGLRLATRLGLRLEPASAAQLDAALRSGYLAMLSGERILAELCLALEDPRPDQVLHTADAWGVTAQLLPGLSWGAELAARCERLAVAISRGEALTSAPLLWAGLLLNELAPPELVALAARYPLPSEVAGLIGQLEPLRRAAPLLALPLPNSAVERLLRPFSPAGVAVLHYAEPAAAEPTAHYLRSLRATRAPLDGHDLLRLGVAPGPAIGHLLDELRAATLDGAVATREEAEAWVRARKLPGS